jgi:hypothetical protein
MSNRLSNLDLIQQIAALNWVARGDEHRELYTNVTGLKVFQELYERLTGSQQIDQLQAQTILKVAAYVQEHPNASEAQLVDFLKKEFATFGTAVQSL